MPFFQCFAREPDDAAAVGTDGGHVPDHTDDVGAAAAAGTGERKGERKGENGDRWGAARARPRERGLIDRQITQYTDLLTLEKRRSHATHERSMTRSRLDSNPVKPERGSTRNSKMRSTLRRQKKLWKGMPVGRTKMSSKTDHHAHPPRDVPSLREWGELSRYVSPPNTHIATAHTREFKA